MPYWGAATHAALLGNRPRHPARPRRRVLLPRLRDAAPDALPRADLRGRKCVRAGCGGRARLARHRRRAHGGLVPAAAAGGAGPRTARRLRPWQRRADRRLGRGLRAAAALGRRRAAGRVPGLRALDRLALAGVDRRDHGERLRPDDGARRDRPRPDHRLRPLARRGRRLRARARAQGRGARARVDLHECAPSRARLRAAGLPGARPVRQSRHAARLSGSRADRPRRARRDHPGASTPPRCTPPRRAPASRSSRAATTTASAPGRGCGTSCSKTACSGPGGQARPASGERIRRES